MLKEFISEMIQLQVSLIEIKQKRYIQPKYFSSKLIEPIERIKIINNSKNLFSEIKELIRSFFDR